MLKYNCIRYGKNSSGKWAKIYETYAQERNLNWKEIGNVIVLWSPEELGLLSLPSRKAAITPYVLQEEEQLFKLKLWHTNIDTNWL